MHLLGPQYNVLGIVTIVACHNALKSIIIYNIYNKAKFPFKAKLPMKMSTPDSILMAQQSHCMSS
jgi:hypothetical protein